MPSPVTSRGTGTPSVTSDGAMINGGASMKQDPPAAAGGAAAATTAIIPPLLPPAAQTGTQLPTTSPHPAPFYISSPPSRESRGSNSAVEPSSPPTQYHASNSSSTAKMIFSDLYRSPRSPLSRLRHSQPQPTPLSLHPDIDADLVSRDKAKQKEAVKRYLAEKVRTDWDFQWPSVTEPAPAAVTPAPASVETPNEDIEGFLEVTTEVVPEDVPSTASDDDDVAIEDSGAEADSETESVYSSVSEDDVHYRPRAEWVSDLSSDEEEEPQTCPSPFRFDNPDSIGAAVKASSMARKARRRRDVRKEMAWNQGLACFEARRNAWTEARTVRVRPKPMSPSSPTPSRRALFWRTRSHSTTNSTSHPLSPTSTHSPTGIASLSPVTTSTSQHSTHSQQGDVSTAPTTGNDSASSSLSPKTTRDSTAHRDLPVETLLPIPPPLLPPQNPMRASITPALYVSIYDKVVVNGMQPSCPINLADTVRACVSGWKRDGEWPPRPAEVQAVVAVRRKKKEQQQQREAKAAAALPSPGTTARRMSFGFLAAKSGGATASGGGEPHGEGIRRSLQKVLSLGHGHGPAAPGGTAVSGGNAGH